VSFEAGRTKLRKAVVLCGFDTQKDGIIFERLLSARGEFMRQRKYLPVLLALMLCGGDVFAQADQDSTKSEPLAKRAISKGLDLISTNPNDTIVGRRSVDDYLPYQGLIIRRIEVSHVGFELSMYDSSKKVANSVVKIANSLHVDTREKTIRQHLLFDSNDPLNPHTLADNERFLRDKDFIMDARIYARKVEGSDSVDVTVLIRDVFSLGVRGGGSLSAPSIGVFDANVGGRAQRVEVRTLIDPDRSPTVGFGLFYRKSSLWGSLANFELGYSQVENDFSLGDEVESKVYGRVERLLVTPDQRIAGALLLSFGESKNVYQKPDSVFLDYAYTRFDGWAGYNLGIKRPVENRARQFVALRYFNGSYMESADPIEVRDQIKYNDAVGVLSEFTHYRKYFYKTRYIFGFGRTEDVPAGIEYSLVAGYLKLFDLERPYFAIKLNAGEASARRNFYQVNLQTGGFVRNNDVEDFVVMAGVTFYTRLLKLRRYNVRSQASLTYTQLFNRSIVNWLEVGNAEIAGFQTDSLQADRRFAIHLESSLFTPWSLLGFRFAPFTSIDVVPVRCVSCGDSKPVFWGFSLGMRARNENLIFGTIEAKATFIPNDEYGEPRLEFSFKQNLRIRSSGSYVKQPSLIAYN
jgi:hypothetical protein